MQVQAPQQARSHATLGRLLDAAESIIRDKGLDALTIPEVVRAAGSSTGSFYARFRDKAALLETLHERACAATVAMADVAFDPKHWEGKSAEDIISAVVVFAVEAFGSRRTMTAAFAEAFAGDPAFAARRATNAVALGERLLALLMTRKDQIGHPHPAQAIPMCLRVVTATLEQRNALDPARPPTAEAKATLDRVRVADAELTRELTRMVVKYLELKPSAKRPVRSRAPR